MKNFNESTYFKRDSVPSEVLKLLDKQPLKFFYSGLIPKKMRKKIREKANLSQQQYVFDYWENILDKYLSEPELFSFPIKVKQSFSTNKIIWQYWGQGWDIDKLPDTVRLCYCSVEKHKGDYLVIRLDDNNLDDYIEFPDFINEKRNNPEFKYAFFSDLLRIYLLYAYGGVWLDATIFMTDNIKVEKRNDLFFYYRNVDVLDKLGWKQFDLSYFNWDSHHRVNILNSILFSSSHHGILKIILSLLLRFWKTQDRIPHYFFFQILFEVLVQRGLIDKSYLKHDDTYPHLLQKNINQPFDLKKFEEIKEKSNLHKLTYFGKCEPSSFYAFLLEKYNLLDEK